MACRQKGTVKWFDDVRGLGLITPEDGSQDLFVLQSSIRSDGFRSLANGEAVEFEIECGNDGITKATEVTGPNGESVQGIRREGGGGRGGRGSGGYGDGRGRGGGGAYEEGGGGGGRKCFRCGNEGHFARDCYSGGN